MIRSFSWKLITFLTAAFCWKWLISTKSFGSWMDVALYAAPLRYHLQTALQSGHFPLWNPYLFGGTPFQASPQSAIFYPPTMIFAFLHLDLGFKCFALSHVLLQFCGFFWLWRKCHFSNSASLVGSFILVFSYFLMAKIAVGHLIHYSGYSWTPLILVFALELAHAPSNKTAWALACVSTLQFFSGHLQVWLVSLLTAMVPFIISVREQAAEEQSRLLKNLALCLGMMACLSLVQLLPSVIFILHSSRNSTWLSSASLYEFASSYSMPWKAFVSWVSPNFFGTPMQGNYENMNRASEYFETSAVYFGWIPLAFFGSGIFLLFKKRKWGILIWIIFFLTLALGKNTPVYSYLWKSLSFLRAPARFYYAAFLGIIVCVLLAWENYLKKTSGSFKLIIFSLIFIDLYFHGQKFVWNENLSQTICASPTLHWLSEHLVFSRRTNSTPMKLANLRIFSNDEIPSPNKAMFFRIENANGYEAIVPQTYFEYLGFTQGPENLTTTGANLGEAQKNSVHLLGVRYWLCLKRQKTAWPLAQEIGPIKIYENPDILYPIQTPMIKRHFTDKTQLYDYLNSKAFDPKKELLLNSPYGQISEEFQMDLGKKPELISFAKNPPERIRMHWRSADRKNFWILLSQTFYPGWEVWTASGKHQGVYLADGHFQAADVTLGADHETLYWLFRPLDFRIGLLFTLVAWIFCAFFFMRLGSRK